MKQQYVYMVMWDEDYEGPSVYGIFKTEKAAEKAMAEESAARAKHSKSYKLRAYVKKLPLNPSQLSINYLYEE